MLDIIDFTILAYLDMSPGSTTTDIGKAVFEPESRDEVKNADNKVRNRLAVLEELNLVSSRNSRPRKYFVNQSLVMVGRGDVIIHDNDGECTKMDMGGDFLAVAGVDGFLIIKPMKELWSAVRV